MNNTGQQTGDSGNTAFHFDRGADWVHLSADLGRLCQDIGEQLHRAAASIDVDAIAEQVRSAVADVAAEARAAADNYRSSPPWSGPTRVRVDIRADAPSQAGAHSSRRGLDAERKAVLDLLSQGKISVEEAARLLDALGG